jgi:hypothetical protein
MNTVRRLGILVVLCWIGAAACAGGSFVCTDDSECRTREGDGVCHVDGYCSFPDPDCASGLRFGEHSGSVSGQCTPVDELGSTTSTSGSASNGQSSSTTGFPDGSSSTDAVTSGVDSADDSTTTGDSSEGSTGDATLTEGATTTVADTTGGPEIDPYGMCSEGCMVPGATCLSNPMDQMMCAPSCQVVADCPEPLEPGYSLMCEDIGDGTRWCFVLCDGETCPAGMVCAVDGVCTWDP